jgi:hypothetical protein
MNFLAIPSKPFALVFNFSALLRDNLNWNSCVIWRRFPDFLAHIRSYLASLIVVPCCLPCIESAEIHLSSLHGEVLVNRAEASTSHTLLVLRGNVLFTEGKSLSVREDNLVLGFDYDWNISLRRPSIVIEELTNIDYGHVRWQCM